MPASLPCRAFLVRAGGLLLLTVSALVAPVRAAPWQDGDAAGVVSAARAPYSTCESGPVNALLLLPDGRVLALNTADHRVEVFGAGATAAVRTAAPAAGAAKKPAPGGPSSPPGGGAPALSPAPSLEWTGSIFTGLEPVAMALDPADPRRLFVSNQLSDTVSVVDLVLRQVVATIDVGDEPAGLALAGGRLLVACARAPLVVPVPGQLNPGAKLESVVAVHSATAPWARIALLPLGASRPRDVALAGGFAYAIAQDSGNHSTLLDETQTKTLGLEQLVTDAFDGAFAVNAVLQRPELVWPNYTRGWVIPNAGRIVFDDEHPALVPQLLDRDVVMLDPGAAAVLGATSGVGTTLLDVERNPATGELWIANTEARNRTRFEPVLRGDAHEHRVTVVAPGGGVTAIVPLEPPLTSRPHAQPAVLAFSQGSAGSFAYVACLGSASVVVLDAVTRLLVAELDVGEIPSGLAADGARGVLYVLSRGEGRLQAFRIGSWKPLGSAPLPYDPEPQLARAGRKHLYDARSSSGHGSDRLSCATCHVFAHGDRLGWDLGDPGGSLSYYFPDEMTDLAGFSGQIVTLPSVPILSPLKGPMVTQTLRGLLDPDTKDDTPGHWRGDRRALQMFAPAFESLNGADAPLPRADMQELLAFLRVLRHPPNPLEPKDRVYTGQLAQGRDLYGMNPEVPGKEYIANSGFLCIKCHKGNFTEEKDFTGARPTVSSGSFTQLFNTAQLRNIYEKDDKFVSGFGALHDGAVDGVRGFMDFSVPNGGLPTFSNLTVADKDAIAAFVKAWDTGMAPMVGAQFTLAPASLLAPGGALAADAALDLLESQARPHFGPSAGGPVMDDALPDIDLIVKGFRIDTDGKLLPRGGRFTQDAFGAWGYLFDTGGFVDRSVLELVVSLGAATFTFTGVPPGTGERLGMDRDEDGLWDLAETLAGTSPVRPDSDGDGWIDGAEAALGGDPAVADVDLPDVTPPALPIARALEIFADCATLNAVSSEPCTLRVELGLLPGQYALPAVDGPPGLRCTHDVVLTGLPAGTTLHYRVTATDVAGLSVAATGSFKTLPPMFHVEDITLEKAGAGGGAVAVTARVLVRDQAGVAPPAGVPVRAFWAGDLGGQAWEQESHTDATGWASFALLPYVPAAPSTVTFSPIYIGTPFPNKAWFVGKGGDTPVFFYDQSANRAHYRDVAVP